MGSTSTPILFPVIGEQLLGVKDTVNISFQTPFKWAQETEIKIRVAVNGQDQLLGYNYVIEESAGAGTGFDTVIFRRAPRLFDTLTCDFYRFC